MASKKKYHCKLCGEGFKWPGQIIKHKRQVHEVGEELNDEPIRALNVGSNGNGSILRLGEATANLLRKHLKVLVDDTESSIKEYANAAGLPWTTIAYYVVEGLQENITEGRMKETFEDTERIVQD